MSTVYCLCRRRSEGFMIQCDDCKEWYHGSCVGVKNTFKSLPPTWFCPLCSRSDALRQMFMGEIQTLKTEVNNKFVRLELEFNNLKTKAHISHDPRGETEEAKKHLKLLESQRDEALNRAKMLEAENLKLLVKMKELETERNESLQHLEMKSLEFSKKLKELETERNESLQNLEMKSLEFSEKLQKLQSERNEALKSPKFSRLSLKKPINKEIQ